MNGEEGGEQSLERFAAGDEQLSAGGEGWESGAAARRAKLRAICDWRPATIGRRGGVEVGHGGRSSERFAARDEQLSAGGEGWELGTVGEA